MDLNFNEMQHVADIVAENEELKKQVVDLKKYYYQFHQDALNYMLKKDVLGGFMKYRKKRKREEGIFLED